MHTSLSLAWFITWRYALSLFYVPPPPFPPPPLISIDEGFYGAGPERFSDWFSNSNRRQVFLKGFFYPKYQSNTQGEKNKAINHWLVVFLTVTESWSTCNAYQQPLLIHWSVVQYCFLISFCLYNRLFYSFDIKTESTRKLNNFDFQWTKTLYQNNLKHIAFFFTFFKG